MLTDAFEMKISQEGKSMNSEPVYAPEFSDMQGIVGR
jgi:hypothetical protein